MIQFDAYLISHVKNMQVKDIFHDCPEQQQQSDPKKNHHRTYVQWLWLTPNEKWTSVAD